MEPKATPDTSYTQHHRASAGLSSDQAGLPSAIRPCCSVAIPAAPCPQGCRLSVQHPGPAPTSPSPLLSGPVQQTPALQWPFRNQTRPFPRERRGPPLRARRVPSASRARPPALHSETPAGPSPGVPHSPTPPLPEVTGARCGPPWPGGVGCTVGRGGAQGHPAGCPRGGFMHRAPTTLNTPENTKCSEKAGTASFCAELAWCSQVGPSVVPAGPPPALLGRCQPAPLSASAAAGRAVS